MHKHTSPGFRAVYSNSVREAAEIFATRAARKAYGRRGYTRVLNRVSWSQDGSVHEFEAFIGYSPRPGETSGHNVRFTVSTC